MSVKKGDTAPNFELVNTNKEVMSLSSQKGKNVVLLFFPLAFTSVCTAELCQMRDTMADYNKLNAVVWGVSVDSPFVLGEFKKQNDLSYDLLSDFNKDVSRAYGALYDEFVLGLKGVSKRAAFVIDTQGKVIHEEVLEKASDLPDFEAIKTALAH